MANDIDKTSPHYKGDFGSIYEVNKKFPTGGVAGDFVVIEGWAHYWNADRATWCVNAKRDSYWDELITNIIEKFKLVRGATYMGVASLGTVPEKIIGAKLYYFATEAGTYKNFGDLVVPQGINVLYSENGSSWLNTTLLEVAQELGVSTKKVVSQKALNEALAKKADKETVNTELAKKFDKESVVQESGEAEDKVMSQKAVSDKLNDLSSKLSDLVKANAVCVADHKHFFDLSNPPKFVARNTQHPWGCFILPVTTGDVFCLGINPGNVNGIIGLSEIPTTDFSTEISDIVEEFSYYKEEINGVWFLTIIDAKNASYIGFTYNEKTADNKDYCVKMGGAFLTQKDVSSVVKDVSSVVNSLRVYYPNPTTYFDYSKSLYCSPTSGNYGYESIIVPISAGDIILTGIDAMTNRVFLSDKPEDIFPQSGCHNISDLIVQVEGDVTKNYGVNYSIYQVPSNIGEAKYLGITLPASLPSVNKFAIVISNNDGIFMTDYDRTKQYMKNMKAVSDATKGNALMEFLPAYFDLSEANHPNGYIGINSINWKCIIVPAVKGDTVRVPMTSGLVSSLIMSSYPSLPGDLEEGVMVTKNLIGKVNGSYTEYKIEHEDARYFSVIVSINSEVPELPLIIDSGNVTEKELQETKEQIQETKEQIPFINHDLGMVKNFNFGKYDDICLIMNGQSLSIGWESVAISTTPMDNCYMLGTDPCTLYRSTGFNGIGINPLKSVTRESPNVSWCNVMSKLIPTKRFITSSVGEGARTIAGLSKTDETSLVEAEFVGHAAIDPKQGHITPADSWKSFLLAVQPGETYYITTSFNFLTEYSAKPKWEPIDNDYNSSVHVGNGGSHISDGQYTAPEGVYYLALCQNNADYVTERAFALKGTANRYEEGFILPMAQLKAVEDNEDRTIGCPAIVWMQGESDSSNTKEYYKEKLVKLKNDMQADIMSIFNQDEKPLFFCYMLAVTSQKQNTIMMAIAECCEENDDMILIAPIYALPDYNNLHLSSNGNRWYGEYIARSTYNALILGKRDNCVVPYQFVIDGSSIRIKVDAPKLPLVIDTWTVQEVPQYGFKVWKDNIEVTISSITLFGDEIILHCSEDISTGVIEVSYAGYNPSDATHYRGTGNIRDSDRWQALQTYWDDTDDKGTINNNSEITYRPKTKEGESLIGKLYPMQNWLQNFYKKLD